MKHVQTHPAFGPTLALLAVVLLLASNGLAQAEPAPVAEAGTCATISLDDLVILAAGELLAGDLPTPRLEGALGETTRVPAVERVAQATDQTARPPAQEFGKFNERERDFMDVLKFCNLPCLS